MDIKNSFNIKNFNIWTVVSLLFLLGGMLFYIWWGLNYGVWVDIGIYSITLVFVLGGILGMLLTLSVKKEAQ